MVLKAAGKWESFNEKSKVCFANCPETSLYRLKFTPLKKKLAVTVQGIDPEKANLKRVLLRYQTHEQSDVSRIVKNLISTTEQVLGSTVEEGDRLAHINTNNINDYLTQQVTTKNGNTGSTKKKKKSKKK